MLTQFSILFHKTWLFKHFENGTQNNLRKSIVFKLYMDMGVR